MDDAADSLGARLGRALGRAGYNQKEAEQRAGLSRGYLSRVLRGERTRIEAARLQCLAEACGVDFTWLSTGHGTMTPPSASEPLSLTHGPSHGEPAVDARGPRDNAFEAALAEAFRAHPFALADLDAVRSLLSAGAASLAHEPALLGPAVAWLQAAATLRRQGRPVTVETFALCLARAIPYA